MSQQATVLTDLYRDSALVETLHNHLQASGARLHVDGMTGSLPAVVIARQDTASLLQRTQE